MAASSGPRRVMSSWALDLRSWRGLRTIDRRPVFMVGFAPSDPMNDATLCTSGFLRTTSAAAR